ncbi:hypothetical protein RB653_001862 [Dictyostelium firmibasis]|uniref:Uncharacterized protein n=1 Tax=Dictyostelium firmibasis TaxID=79012 RepID=A0AAN7TXL7_9MYCE
MITKVEYLLNPNKEFINGPLSVILGYAGCTSKILKKFAKTWHDRGFNVITVPHSVDTSVTFYDEMSYIVLKYIDNYFKNKNNKRMICFHIFSAGSMFYGKLLECFQKKNEYNYLMGLIKGAVFDSAPIYDENDCLCGTLTAFGVDIKNVNEDLIKSNIEILFLEVFKPIWIRLTTNYYKYLISPLNKWPHLVISSPNDFVILSVHKFIDQIKSIPGMKEFKQFKNNNSEENNLFLIEKEFDSEHCSHFFKYTKEYQQSINQLIDLSFMKNKNEIISKL